MKKRNWLVEDNLVAMYVALYKYKDLHYRARDIHRIIPLSGFPMRVQNYKAIATNGRHGLTAGLKSPLFNELFSLFKSMPQKKFAALVNSVLRVRSEVDRYARTLDGTR